MDGGPRGLPLSKNLLSDIQTVADRNHSVLGRHSPVLPAHTMQINMKATVKAARVL